MKAKHIGVLTAVLSLSAPFLKGTDKYIGDIPPARESVGSQATGCSVLNAESDKAKPGIMDTFFRPAKVQSPVGGKLDAAREAGRASTQAVGGIVSSGAASASAAATELREAGRDAASGVAGAVSETAAKASAGAGDIAAGARKSVETVEASAGCCGRSSRKASK